MPVPRQGGALIGAGLLSLFTATCSSVASRPHERLQMSGDETAGPLSLFPDDQAVLADADIERILQARPVLRDRLRIAVLHIGHRSVDFAWLYHSEPVPATWLQEKLFASLNAAAGVHDASYLPSFLIPPKRTIGHLREAAARYQADLLLVFQSECRTHQQYRFFQASQAKAYCLADAGLLDVRTGLVPFTSRAVQEYLLEEHRSDLDLGDTVRRSEQTAVEAAMAENAQNLVTFLGSLRPGRAQ